MKSLKKYISLILTLIMAASILSLSACDLMNHCIFCALAPDRLETPANINVDLVDSAVTWDKVEGASHYTIYRVTPPKAIFYTYTLIYTTHYPRFCINQFNSINISIVAHSGDSSDARSSHRAYASVNRYSTLAQPSVAINGDYAQWQAMEFAARYRVVLQTIPHRYAIYTFYATQNSFNIARMTASYSNEYVWGVQVTGLGYRQWTRR